MSIWTTRTIIKAALALLPMCALLLVGCTFSIGTTPSDDNRDDGSIVSSSAGNLDYHEVRVVLPAGYEDRPDRFFSEEDVELVQNYFDSNRTAIGSDRIGFLFINGAYFHDYRSVLIVGVFINTTSEVITGFGGDITLSPARTSDVEIPTWVIGDVFFPIGSVGELLPYDALLFHHEFQVEGFTEDFDIDTQDILSTFTNVTYATR